MFPSEEANPKVFFIESWKNSLIKPNKRLLNVPAESSDSSSSTEQNNANDRKLSFSAIWAIDTSFIRRLHPVRISARRSHRHHCADKKRLSPEEIENLPQRLKVPDFLSQRHVRIIHWFMYTKSLPNMTVCSSPLFEEGNEISKKLSGGGGRVQNPSPSWGETS